MFRAEAGICVTAGGCWRTETAARTQTVHGSTNDIAGLSIVADQEPGEEPAPGELCHAAAQAGGGGPHHLCVVTGVGAELVVGHTGLGGREQGYFSVPRLHRLRPLGGEVARSVVEGLVEVLTHPEPLDLPAVRTVVAEHALVRQPLGHHTQLIVPLQLHHIGGRRLVGGTSRHICTQPSNI